MNDVGGVAVGIPAHDEAARIDRSLASVVRAARGHIPVTVVIAADSCRDATASIARARLGHAPPNVETRVIEIGARCAGIAREAACREAHRLLGSRIDAATRTWIATTDADTLVPDDWLATHLRWARAGADVVAGLVRVDPADPLDRAVRGAIARELHGAAGAPHQHVFGANLGIDASWWARVGGFPPVPVGEDRRVVERLRARGARVVAIPDAVVTTSGRLTPRAPRGFGAHLAALSAVAAVKGLTPAG